MRQTRNRQHCNRRNTQFPYCVYSSALASEFLLALRFSLLVLCRLQSRLTLTFCTSRNTGCGVQGAGAPTIVPQEEKDCLPSHLRDERREPASKWSVLQDLTIADSVSSKWKVRGVELVKLQYEGYLRLVARWRCGLVRHVTKLGGGSRAVRVVTARHRDGHEKILKLFGLHNTKRLSWRAGR